MRPEELQDRVSKLYEAQIDRLYLLLDAELDKNTSNRDIERRCIQILNLEQRYHDLKHRDYYTEGGRT